MRSLVLVAACAALSAQTADAQSVFDSELRFAPQYMQYKLKAPVDETISQLAIPLFVSIPLSPRFSMDVGTSYASSVVTSPGAARSELSGLTDTQVRGNIMLGSDFVVLTVGLNVPTGTVGVTQDQFAVASRIGSDFLSFPIASMGTGFAGTGGIAVARPLGSWNLGLGAAVRRATSYEPFNIPNQTLRFQPGNEYRLRAGVDRLVGAGRLALALTFSKFGEDDAGGSRYRTGSRLIGQTVFNTVIGGSDVVFGVYDVYRSAGQYASGEASGTENLANAFASISFRPGGMLLEPTAEVRHWLQDLPALSGPSQSQSSYLGSLGVRTRFELAGITVFPAAGYSVGQLAVAGGAGDARAGLTGFKAQIAMRAAPFGGQ